MTATATEARAPGTGAIGWGGIARLGLVQAALGSVVVLTTSLINRVMVIELHLAASVPGALVGFHYALQMLRPRWGHASDGARRTPWIVGGMALLCAGGVLAGFATATMATRLPIGLALAALAFAMIGIGVGACGTALLTLLSDRVAPARKPAAASIVWIMMIAGFVVTSALASRWLAPFSYATLMTLCGAVGASALIVTCLAVAGLERGAAIHTGHAKPPFRAALAAVWADAAARRFTGFVFVSMLAYSAQDLILEPFAGLVFRMTPAETTAITSLQNGGVLIGMLCVATLGRRLGAETIGGMVRTTMIGCALSAASLIGIAVAGLGHVDALLHPAVAALGFSNGVFAVSAIGLMMSLANRGGAESAGVRMGVWGAAQAIAFGGGGFAGTLAVDALRLATGATIPAYAAVFAMEAILFAVAATMLRTRGAARPQWVTASGGGIA